MKYLVIIYGNRALWESFPPEQASEAIAAQDAINRRYLEDDNRISGHHLLHAVRGHVLAMAGRPDEASDAFATAARRTSSLPEERYLRRRANGLRGKGRPDVEPM